jgi:AP-3 complex subunit beta
VVALKKLLQLGTVEHSQIVGQLAKLLAGLEDPSARASVTWVIGEYCDKVPLLAPDVFRLLAKGFVDEHDLVKLQILNLGAKLYLSNPEQTRLIFQYVLNLCKYDRNYDIRDRARLIRGTLCSDKLPVMRAHGKRLMFATKQPPEMERPSEMRARFALGSLSHVVNHVVSGYDTIPDFPTERPDPSVRDTFSSGAGEAEAQAASGPYGAAVGGGDRSFYSDEGSGSWSGSDSGSWSGSGSGSWSGSDSGSWSGSDDSGSWSSSASEDDAGDPLATVPSTTTSSTSSSYADATVAAATVPSTERADVEHALPPAPEAAVVSSMSDSSAGDDLLGGLHSLSVDDSKSAAAAPLVAGAGAMAFAATDAPLTAEPMPIAASASDTAGTATVQVVSVEYESQPLLSEVVGGGLSVEYKFVRRPSSYGKDKCTVKFTLENHSQNPLTNINVAESVVCMCVCVYLLALQ